MPTIGQAQLAIEEHFKTEWNDRTVVQWTNAPKPTELDAETFDDPYWVSFDVEVSDSFIKGVSDAPEYRYTGRVVIDVHMQKNLGPFLFTQIMNDLNGIFRGRTLSGVRLGAPIPSPQIGDDTWFRRVVSFPLNFDDK